MLATKPDCGRDLLSDRQAQCLALASKGMTSKEIGRELGISPSTVDNHLRVVAAKMQVGGRRQAIRQLANSTGFPEAVAQDLAAPLPTRPSKKIGLFPPLGGSANTLSAAERLKMVVRIALFATMALAAITTTISGVVSILGR